MHIRFILNLFFIFIGSVGVAKIVELPIVDSTGHQQETSSFLGQAGMGVNPDPLMPPRLNVKTYKLSAEIETHGGIFICSILYRPLILSRKIALGHFVMKS
ncbi:MAG: hypothetical protein IPN36_14735 [Bacteroidetes bacterium]|nr:hypothetical protein [Bacteroidota bacterium]